MHYILMYLRLSLLHGYKDLSTLTVRGKYRCTTGLQFNETGTDKKKIFCNLYTVKHFNPKLYNDTSTSGKCSLH